MPVQVVQHDPHWKHSAKLESGLILQRLGEVAIAIHHIGSTAIPGIHAKPILDFLLEVRSVEELDLNELHLQALGYECLGEYGIPERRYFRKPAGNVTRTHHVHAFEHGHHRVFEHLLFRDYMIAHPQQAEEYSQLKTRLAAQYPDDIESYMDGKDPFIKAQLARAKSWHSRGEPIDPSQGAAVPN